jgi:hypothetical protein
MQHVALLLLLLLLLLPRRAFSTCVACWRLMV